MFHRCSHGGHRHDGHGRRFARGEHGHDGPHLGRGRHGGFDRGSRGGLGRFFAHGDLRLVILHLIAEKPRHGYEVIKAIEERVAGAYSPSPGVIYPTLTLLEELGYVTVSTGEGAKKLHTITAEGRAFLDANRAAVDVLLARMDEASRIHGGGPAPQVVRAMENLKLALRLRLARGPLSEEQANAVAAALDTAATSVERA
jgi:DNA-binding PadR family transcriptional regulator